MAPAVSIETSRKSVRINGEHANILLFVSSTAHTAHVCWSQLFCRWRWRSSVLLCVKKNSTSNLHNDALEWAICRPQDRRPCRVSRISDASHKALCIYSCIHEHRLMARQDCMCVSRTYSTYKHIVKKWHHLCMVVENSSFYCAGALLDGQATGYGSNYYFSE